MKTSFLRLTPALALIATLGLGAAQAQNNNPASATPATPATPASPASPASPAVAATPATPATPAVTKQVDAGKSAAHKKHAEKTVHNKTDKKAVDGAATHAAKPATTTATTPKS